MSSTGYAPAIVLAGPLPAPLPFGLFSAATIVGGEERWGGGVNVTPYPDTQHLDVFDICSAGTDRTKNDGVDDGFDQAYPFFLPFTVYLTDLCNARGMGRDSALDDRARLAFQAIEQWAVEHEFAFGTGMPANPFLTDSDYEDIASGAHSSLEALALLEKRLGDTGKAGVIHADRATVSAWSYGGALSVVGEKLVTYLGTPVAAGGGYAQMVPDGSANPAPDQGYAFVTGPVEIRRDDSITILPGSLAEALDRSQNLVTYRAERDYLVEWDRQLQAAILVDRSL
jgi:hypothetical protein